MPIVVYVLGLAIFSIGTSELMVAGMMSSLSESFNISIGQVGHLISYFAFGVMFGGPVLTYVFLKLKVPYRPTLLIMLLSYAIVQAIMAFNASYNILIVIRIILGILCAGCLSLSLATSMVDRCTRKNSKCSRCRHWWVHDFQCCGCAVCDDHR